MAAETVEYKLFGLKLWQQVLIALALGVAVGMVIQALVSQQVLSVEASKQVANNIKIFGTVFINLIKMVVVPLIFLALVSGITSMDDPTNFTRIGFKGIITYLSTASFAVLIGISAGLIFEPGKGVAVDLSSFAKDVPEASKASPSIGDFLLGLIPTNAFRAMTEDNFLQVVLFSLFFGFTINMLGDRVSKLKELLREASYVVFKMIEYIVRLAPMAVFGFMAWSIGTQGPKILETLAMLVVAVLAACVLQYILFGLMIMFFGRISPMPFYRKMMPTQLMAFSTSSSKATLTTAMRELQTKMGVSEQSSNFLMPLGACINMDGTAIYLGICALFFSQLFGIELHAHDYVVLVLTCTLGSIGAAGIPSGSIIFMGMVLSSVGLPLDGIGLLLGVDRLLDMVRTTINITGDAAITLMIDSSEDKIDKEIYFS